ncbi:hypothetical protein ACFLV7_14415 [Chloroflexota bacterium]
MQILGEHAPVAGIPFWTDAALLSAAGVETAIIGPIGAGLHTSEESVELDSLLDLTRILIHTAIIYSKSI